MFGLICFAAFVYCISRLIGLAINGCHGPEIELTEPVNAGPIQINLIQNTLNMTRYDVHRFMVFDPNRNETVFTDTYPQAELAAKRMFRDTAAIDALDWAFENDVQPDNLIEAISEHATILIFEFDEETGTYVHPVLGQLRLRDVC